MTNSSEVCTLCGKTKKEHCYAFGEYWCKNRTDGEDCLDKFTPQKTNSQPLSQQDADKGNQLIPSRTPVDNTQTPPTLKDLERFAFYVNGDIKVCLSKDIAEKIKLLRDELDYMKMVIDTEVTNLTIDNIKKKIDEIMGNFEK